MIFYSKILGDVIYKSDHGLTGTVIAPPKKDKKTQKMGLGEFLTDTCMLMGFKCA